MPSRKSIAELLSRRRGQIPVHSITHYETNDNLISDSIWSAWATEPEGLQVEYSGVAAEVLYAKESKDFDHPTGMNLPLNGPWAANKARQLTALENKGTYGQYEQLKVPI